jgi:hypothetical protein
VKNEVDDVGPVLFIPAKDRGIHYRITDFALLNVDSVAGKRAVLHFLFIDETYAVLVDHQVRLLQNDRDAWDAVVTVRQKVDHLDAHLRLRCARLLSHPNAVALEAGNREVEHVFPESIPRALLYHLRVVAGAACTDYRCFA